MSANDKFGLGYGDHRYDGILRYENEVLQSVFMNKESETENQPLYDRFVTAEGMHAGPPPMTAGPDREVDDSMFTYGPKQSKTSESDTQTSNFDSCESNSSVETLESVPEPVVVEPKVVSQPKVWSDAPIIEEYESDSDDEYVIQPSKEQEKPSFAFVNTVKHVKTPRETVKEQNTYSPSPKADKRDWNGLMSKRLGLGYGFTKKACFVCGSFSHLIRDCDFHEKRMAKQVELNKKKGKGTGQGENRPVWNNVQRLNHQNKFVPKAVLTKTGIFPVNTARQNLSSQAATTSTTRKVNTARPIVNEIKPRNNFYKSHSPNRRPFNRTKAPRTKFSNQKVNTASLKAVSAVGGIRETDNRQRALKNKRIVDSGCSRHMTRNKVYLAEYQDYNGGLVAFEGSKGYITGKGKIKTGKLDFEDVCFVKELQHLNLFSMSHMCDNKNKVLFTDTKCLVLSSDFKLPDENQVLLRIPRQNNMYSFNLENIVPSGGLACLIAKAIVDESNKWHRRLGHVNFKNLNKLVKGNLVRGLPSKIFQNDNTCVACQKGKQHKASCKAKIVSSISQTLQLLHMDLFGPTSVRSINHKTYCLFITNDFSRFSWVFFLRTKNKTSGILKDFIRQIENQLNQKVKIIRCDNGIEFKNRDIIEFCGSKGIKREYSNVRIPQQNRVAERKNKTLIEAARTMLAVSFLPNTFWAEAVSTVCYVLNRVLVTKPQNKTPYELITGKIPIISYIRPFGCHVTILNTIDHLGKFEEKYKLTFQKALFSPQWKYLIHTILHCLSSKSTSWNEFSTNIALAVICLATNQKFNFSKLIFDGMLRNLDNPKKKFLMYPRFLMVFLNNQIELGEPFNDVYITPAHTLKVFSNMSRKGVKFSGKVTPLFDSMLVPHQAPEGEDSMDSLEGTNGSEGDQELFVLCTNVSNRVLALEASKDAQAAEIIKLNTGIKKLKKKSHPGRKNAKPGPTLDDSTFDDLDADLGMDYMDTEEPVNEGRLSKETKELNVTHDTEDEDIFLADALVMLSDKTKLKGVAIKEVKESDMPKSSILTLKPLPSIDLKDKELEKEKGGKTETRTSIYRFIQKQIDESGSHDGISLDLSRLVITLNRLERSIKSGIYILHWLDTKDLDLSETVLELQDLFDSFELEVWSFMDVERQEFPFYFPKQCYFPRNSSSDPYDIDAHLLKYNFKTSSVPVLIHAHQCLIEQTLNLGNNVYVCTVAVQQGPVRARVLNDLSAEEKERYKADIRATNILLQSIPKDIYSLINHYTDAKDIWENVKMILEGSELTKDDRESQLYDEFEHFPSYS
ncbi:putative ribonuclease H-like domain-containing protein [Tanacetum coccineum]